MYDDYEMIRLNSTKIWLLMDMGKVGYPGDGHSRDGGKGILYIGKATLIQSLPASLFGRKRASSGTQGVGHFICWIADDILTSADLLPRAVYIHCMAKAAT
jgi:hypothetical protein